MVCISSLIWVCGHGVSEPVSVNAVLLKSTGTPFAQHCQVWTSQWQQGTTDIRYGTVYQVCKQQIGVCEKVQTFYTSVTAGGVITCQAPYNSHRECIIVDSMIPGRDKPRYPWQYLLTTSAPHVWRIHPIFIACWLIVR